MATITNTYEINKSAIYSKFSPYGNQPTGLFGFGVKQPYVFTDLNHTNDFLVKMKRYESQALPIGSGPEDLIRITKMMGSGTGIKFLLKQFMLQTAQPFNETRIFNPLSTILAAARPASLYLLGSPMRHFDKDNPLGSLTGGLLGSDKGKFVSGTTGSDKSKPTNSSGVSYKGFLRNATQKSGVSHFNNSTAGGFNIGGPVGAAIGAAQNIMGMFPSSPPTTVAGKPAIYRSDEDAYQTYLFKKYVQIGKDKDLNIKLYSPLATTNTWAQQYGNIKTGPNVRLQKSSIVGSYSWTISAFKAEFKPYMTQVGYVSTDDVDASFVDVRKIDVDKQAKDSKSNITTFATNTSAIAPTNGNRGTVSEQLNKLLSSANVYKGYQITEKVKINLTDISYKALTSHVVSSDKGKKVPSKGYSNLMQSKGLSVEDDRGYGYAGTAKRDKVNSLTVLEKWDSVNYGADKFGIHYKPYKDDIIAFYFHDLVNERYIPFRATVKSLSENSTAEWSDIAYSGRADKLYNYKGFSRKLNFTFSVVANSIKELLPMWQRINYFSTCVKPSKYTQSTGKISSYFVVPPMMTVTIGDMYKEQPIMIGTVTVSIPDDALWETTPETNIKNDSDWTYFRDVLQWKDSKGKYAQFPRSCDIQIDGQLVEQEIPQMGKHNFGAYGIGTTTPFSNKLII